MSLLDEDWDPEKYEVRGGGEGNVEECVVVW